MNKIKQYALILSFAASSQAMAQQQSDIANIEKLCGCYSVNFRYAETFSPSESYKYHDREEMNAVELVLPVEKSDKKYVLQHLLVINDSIVIKHWREEWLYESPVIYEYTGDRVWTKKTLAADAVKNKWTQTVWEVSDEPRYQGISPWIINDGKTYWESTADAPLPRREYTVRSDYNVMKRHNRIILTDNGYVHEQDNDKILREGKTEKLIAQEKGYNSYFKMDDTECKAAEEWWKKNEQFWTVIRHEWEKRISDADVVKLHAKADDQMLHEHFNVLWKEWRDKKLKSPELETKVNEVLAKFF